MPAVQTRRIVITLAALCLDGAYGLVGTRQSLVRKEDGAHDVTQEEDGAHDSTQEEEKMAREGNLDSEVYDESEQSPDPGPDPCCHPGNMTTQDLLDCFSNNIAPGGVELALFMQCHSFKMCMGCYNLTKQMYIPYCRGIMRGLEGTGLVSSVRRRRAPQYPAKKKTKSPRRRRGYRFFGHKDDSWGEGDTLKTSLEESRKLRSNTSRTRFNATRVLTGVNHCVHPIDDPINAWACDRNDGTDSCVKWAIQDCKGLDSWCYHAKFCTSKYVNCAWKSAHCDGWSTDCCDDWKPGTSKTTLDHLLHPDHAGTYGANTNGAYLFERANRKLEAEGDKSSPTVADSGLTVVDTMSTGHSADASGMMVVAPKYVVDAALKGKCMGFEGTSVAAHEHHAWGAN